MTATVTTDASGAVTLSAELCRAAGIAPGTALIADVADGRIILARPGPSLAEQILALANALPPGTLDGLPEDAQRWMLETQLIRERNQVTDGLGDATALVVQTLGVLAS